LVASETGAGGAAGIVAVDRGAAAGAEASVLSV
jgi:hypothetical protein